MKKTELKCPHCGEIFTVDEAGYAAILTQVRTAEFDEAVNARLGELQRHMDEKHDLRLEKELSSQLRKAENAFAGEKEELIKKIDSISRRLQEADMKVLDLTSKNESAEQAKNLAVLQATNELKDRMNAQKSEFEELLANERAKADTELAKLSLNLEQQKQQTEFYKDLKTKMSTKMVGETLERHCEISFEQIHAYAFPNAVFGKDNDSRTGSKGDYIFRENDPDSGVELLSIMFEMKNVTDTNSVKKKNEDFFAELDKDRREKGCEYAVLVSLLEPDNDLYNAGILDVSHKYPKMYVIRPQCFIAIIGLLRNSSLGALEYKKELEIVREQHFDISEFEDRLQEFKDDFGSNVEKAGKKFQDAITGIDKAIEQMQKIKEALTLSNRHLIAANNKVEKVTVKKLTKDNPTVTAMIEEARKNKQ